VNPDWQQNWDVDIKLAERKAKELMKRAIRGNAERERRDRPGDIQL